MTGETNRLPWGLNAHPNDSPGYWGARAIKSGGSRPIDLLPDRQSGGGDLFGVLADLLDKRGGMAIAQARVYALCDNFLMKPDESREFTIIDCDLMKMVANTNGSHGYIYLSAWLKPEFFALEGAKWSGEKDPPEVGDFVHTSVWERGKEDVRVLANINLHGHRFVVFGTGRKVPAKELRQLREWRQPTVSLPGSGRGMSALENLSKPSLSVGLTVGHELR
jgi:hypothetical protein